MRCSHRSSSRSPASTGSSGATLRDGCTVRRFSKRICARLHNASPRSKRAIRASCSRTRGHNLALHYRLAPALEREVRSLVEHAVAELGEGFEVQAGKMVYELKPGGHDKGSAIEAFMSEAPFAGRVPVFIGDDLTDEFGFATVQRLGGHGVKVGDGESAAQWRLAEVGAVRAWLASAVK